MKSAKRHGILCFLFFLVTASFAQTHSISGKIIDSKSLEPIPFANVFLNNSTIGAATEVNGEFILKNIQQIGSYELVVSSVGYDPYKVKINLTDAELKVGVIRLIPNLIELNTVEVKGSKDVEWERKVKKFTKIFLGDDPIAEQCVITNPWVINFQEDNTKNKLLAAASSPIQIENKALGYKVNFYLTRFVADNVSYFIQGNALFEVMKNEDPQKENLWKINRENSYHGSSQHLFKSIIDKQIRGEGFNLYSAALGFENLKTRSTTFKVDLGKVIVVADTSAMVSPGGQLDVYKISWKGQVEAHFRNEKVRNNVYQDIRYPVSWISLKKDFVLVNKQGIPLNPTEVTVSGAMSEERIAYMLPIDYVPMKQERMAVASGTEPDVSNPLFEKIYIHTDKPYYYPGETMWLKGYLNYSDYTRRDTLSGTVYLELINGIDKSIVRSKVLKIDSGSFHSDFILPDTLKPAPYFIRSYTNWIRNYGEDNLYTLYTPILNLSRKPEFLPYQSNEESLLKISADKSEYDLREKINLTLETKEADGDPIISNLSISVTDAEQVVDVRTSPNILKDFAIKETPKPILEANFPIERGLGFSGQLITDSKKIDKTRLDVIQTNSRSFFAAETNAKGYFNLNNLNFYDSSTFLIRINKSSNQKVRVIKKINLLPRNIPPISFGTNFQAITLQNTQSPQRETSTFEMSANTRMLKEVMVKGSKTDAVTKRPYGKADYILTAKDFNTSYGNLLQALPGKVPGLVVRQAANADWVVYIQRAAANSMNPQQVQVLVNDVFMGGTPADILANIAPATVETIEVKNTVNVLYGGQGGGGIVSIYTKKGAEDGVVHLDQSTIKVAGYNRPRVFPTVDYSVSKDESPDYRSLIYWNPSINTNPETGIANVSFYASDLARQYRVKVEGVTESGEPLHKEFMISVKKRN
jgi:hypothetical protein